MQRKDLHHEDNEGGWTMREYTEPNGTEKAYDSGFGVGKSINTPSNIVEEDRQQWASRTYLRPHQAVPLS